MTPNNKLIEVTVQLEAINRAVARKKSIRHGHPSTPLLRWARAVIFKQMADDSSIHPDLFETERKQKKERGRLFKIIQELVLLKNTTNEEVRQKTGNASRLNPIQGYVLPSFLNVQPARAGAPR